MATEIAQLTTILDAAIEAHAFSGVIDIRHRDTVPYARAAGYADRSNKLPNTLETRFGIASGTKFFTALAIGKLIATRKLSFSTKLKDCVTAQLPVLFVGDHHPTLAHPYVWHPGLFR
jgi:CubicO group peptidase (beta-lactamase class C family)